MSLKACVSVSVVELAEGGSANNKDMVELAEGGSANNKDTPFSSLKTS